MSEAANVKHWQTLSFRDADAMMAWLSAIGFTEHATYRDEADASVVGTADAVYRAVWGRPGLRSVCRPDKSSYPDGHPVTASRRGARRSPRR